MAWRDRVVDSDPREVERLVAATGFFRADEVAIAVELVEERLAKGAASGYEFLFADDGPETAAAPQAERALAGYACFGPVPLTIDSWDLYWIAVHPDRQGHGLGRRLLEEVEHRVRSAGGRRLWVETSGRPLYDPTRGFYLSRGYRLCAELEDFYSPGDPKVVFGKSLEPEGAP